MLKYILPLIPKHKVYTEPFAVALLSSLPNGQQKLKLSMT